MKLRRMKCSRCGGADSGCYVCEGKGRPSVNRRRRASSKLALWSGFVLSLLTIGTSAILTFL